MSEKILNELRDALFLTEIIKELQKNKGDYENKGNYVEKNGGIYYKTNVPEVDDKRAAVATIDEKGKITPTAKGLKEFEEILDAAGIENHEIIRALVEDGIFTENGCKINDANKKKFDLSATLKQCDIGCYFSKKIIGNFSVEDKETTGKFYAVLAKEFNKIASGDDKTYIFPDKELKYLEDRIRKQEDGVYYCEAKILDTEGKLTQIGKVVGQLMLNSVSDRISEKEVNILYKVDCEEIDKNELNEAIADAKEVKGNLNSEFKTMENAGINNDGVYYGNNDNDELGLE